MDKERRLAGEARLAAALKRLIALEGPISVERYMALCLGHRRHGYYMTRDPFGAAGDFITAPEISQMFGELIGLWAATVWHMMGAPPAINLVELGPGRGTLMADALRAAQALPAFLEAIQVHLVETSPVLREAQRRTLGVASLRWHGSIETLPAGPSIVIGNEFLDALPIRQFHFGAKGWHERLIGLDESGALAFGLSPDPVRLDLPPASSGMIAEQAEIGLEIVGMLAGKLRHEGGAALFIDYGHVASGFGDTLQAMRQHRFIDVLAMPGEADLTAHVDFAQVAAAASKAGAAVHGPETQGEFLMALGLEQRRDALLAAARAREQKAAVESAYDRLTDQTPKGMGALFKAVAFARGDLPPLPGFTRMTHGQG